MRETSWEKLLKYFVSGKIYRRKDLLQASKSLDRDLMRLCKEGSIEKIGPGIYLKPKKSSIGTIPPNTKKLIEKFLGEKRFLTISFDDYNKLGLGLTQLYNFYLVYNYRRHEKKELAGNTIVFKRVPNFPHKVTKEFLLIDLLNNLDLIADEKNNILDKIKNKLKMFNEDRLLAFAKEYGKLKTKKTILTLLGQDNG